MPITDSILYMSDAQAITATAPSANVLDLGVANPNIGQGNPIVTRFEVRQSFNNLTSLTIALQGSADGTFTPALDYGSFVSPVANLAQGSYQIELKVPDRCARYLRAYYTVTGTAPTTGAITAFIDNSLGLGGRK